MKKIYGKECNTAKGVSIANEFDGFKDVLFGEKIIRRKIKRIQSKKHKLRIMKLKNYLCHVFTIKDVCYMMVFVCWLIFIKIVPQVVKRLKRDFDKKDCNKEDCDN